MADVAIETPVKGKHGGKRAGAGGPRTRPDATAEDIQTGGLLKLSDEQLGMDFFEMIRTFEETEWREHLQMYLHRLAPITDRTKTGNFKYLQKYTAVTDPDDVMKEFGSGGYRLTLNRFNPVNRTSTRLREHVFDIENRNYPPVVPFGEWIDDERNKKWLWAKPALLAHQQQSYAANGVGMNGPAFDSVQMLNTIVDAVTKFRPDATKDETVALSKMVIDEIRSNRDYERKSNDPGQMMAIVKMVLDAAKPPPAPAGGDGFMALMMQQLKAAQDTQTMLLTRLLDSGSHKGPSTLEVLKEIKEAAGMFRGGGSREAETTGWDVARDLGTEALKVLGFVGQIYISRLTQPGQQPRPGQPPVPVTDIQVLETQPAQMTPEEQANMIKQISTAYGQMFDEITPHLVDHFHNFDGLEFREWFVEEYGKATYRGIRGMSKETFLGVIEVRKKEAPSAVAAKLGQLAPPEKLAQFIDDFLSDRPVPEEDEETNDDPAEDTLPVRPAAKEF